MSEPKKDRSNFGVAVGLVLCGLALLAFPKWVNMATLASAVFYIVGLAVLLIGLLGSSVEWFRR